MGQHRIIDKQASLNDPELIMNLGLKGLHIYELIWCEIAEDSGVFELDARKIYNKLGVASTQYSPEEIQTYLQVLIKLTKIVPFCGGKQIYGWTKNLKKFNLKDGYTPKSPFLPLPPWVIFHPKQKDVTPKQYYEFLDYEDYEEEISTGVDKFRTGVQEKPTGVDEIAIDDERPSTERKKEKERKKENNTLSLSHTYGGDISKELSTPPPVDNLTDEQTKANRELISDSVQKGLKDKSLPKVNLPNEEEAKSQLESAKILNKRREELSKYILSREPTPTDKEHYERLEKGIFWKDLKDYKANREKYEKPEVLVENLSAKASKSICMNNDSFLRERGKKINCDGIARKVMLIFPHGACPPDDSRFISWIGQLTAWAMVKALEGIDSS